MLAARSRGLVTCWTNLHQFFEKEAAELSPQKSPSSLTTPGGWLVLT